MKHSIYPKKNQSNKSSLNQVFKATKRKQRGNTLVPVVIGIAITAVATASFLNQGADIASRNKVGIAANEITTMLYDWNLLRTTNAVNAIGTADNPSAPAAMSEANIFGVSNNSFSGAGSATPGLVFTTDVPSSCTVLSGIFHADIEGVSGSTCAGSQLTITLN